MNEADAKFVKGLLGKKVGFQMGVRPVGAVDEKQLVIHDVAVCIQGEALGHGVWLDDAFIRAVIEQGNAAEKGLLCHFGHEDSNAGRIKNYMGVFGNFVEKPATGHDGAAGIGAFADIKFSRTANEQGENVRWVMGLARERPDALGLSIVFSIADYKVKTADGGEVMWSAFIEGRTITTWGEYFEAVDAFFGQSADGRLYVVMGKLYGADFVAEGAATDGLFERGEADAADLTPAQAALARLTFGEGNLPPPEGGEGETPPADGAGETPPAGGEEDALAALRAACDKRIAGFQSMHDKKVSEMSGQIADLQKELGAAKAAASAFENERDDSREELARTVAERDAARERLSALEDAHRRLTGGALTVGDGAPEAKSMSEFVSDHGGDFSRAVREDPDTYRRICAAHGWKPAALAR